MTRRARGLGLLSGRTSDDDPMAGVANLFDVGIVFALGFLVALVSALHLVDVFNPTGTVTVTRERPDGLEIMVKKGREITVRRLTKEPGSGNGTRLGVAYQLGDGSVVYVPEAPEGR